MINNFADCLIKQFVPLTKAQFQSAEPFDSHNTIMTLFVESCPSMVPHAEPVISHEAVPQQQQPRYECKGEQCWYAHSMGQYRRPPFKENGELAYLPIPCGRNQTIPATGIKNCHNGHTCNYAHSNPEINYHPYMYRTVACPKSKNKCTTPWCPFSHTKKEKRDAKTYIK